MDNVEFANTRKGLSKTRKQLSSLLGISLKTIRSYEKGWRYVPANVERQLLSLSAAMAGKKGYKKSYWQIYGCTPDQRLSCPAWELRVGQASWLMNASMCHGSVREVLPEQMTSCRNCEMLQGLS